MEVCCLPVCACIVGCLLQELRETMSVLMLMVPPTRFGYAEFASPQQAKKALKSLSEAELDGRTLRIDFATPRGGGGGGGGNRGTPRGGRGTPRGGRGGKS